MRLNTSTSVNKEVRIAMKARYIVLIVVIIVLLAVVGIFIYERAHVSFHKDENGTSVSIIGGADGPTSRVKYVSSNSILSDNVQNQVFKKFIDFVNRMLFSYSLDNRG